MTNSSRCSRLRRLELEAPWGDDISTSDQVHSHSTARVTGAPTSCDLFEKPPRNLFEPIYQFDSLARETALARTSKALDADTKEALSVIVSTIYTCEWVTRRMVADSLEKIVIPTSTSPPRPPVRFSSTFEVWIFA